MHEVSSPPRQAQSRRILEGTRKSSCVRTSPRFALRSPPRQGACWSQRRSLPRKDFFALEGDCNGSTRARVVTSSMAMSTSLCQSELLARQCFSEDPCQSKKLRAFTAKNAKDSRRAEALAKWRTRRQAPFPQESMSGLLKTRKAGAVFSRELTRGGTVQWIVLFFAFLREGFAFFAVNAVRPQKIDASSRRLRPPIASVARFLSELLKPRAPTTKAAARLSSEGQCGIARTPLTRTSKCRCGPVAMPV